MAHASALHARRRAVHPLRLISRVPPPNVDDELGGSARPLRAVLPACAGLDRSPGGEIHERVSVDIPLPAVGRACSRSRRAGARWISRRSPSAERGRAAGAFPPARGRLQRAAFAEVRGDGTLRHGTGRERRRRRGRTPRGGDDAGAAAAVAGRCWRAAAACPRYLRAEASRRGAWSSARGRRSDLTAARRRRRGAPTSALPSPAAIGDLAPPR
jgi:hypothetical protein